MTGGKTKRVAMLHYTCPPIVGGVEAIMAAHASLFAADDYSVRIIAGRNGTDAIGDYTIIEPLLDSKNPRLLAINAELDMGRVPTDFARFEDEIFKRLQALLAGYDACIVHNAFSLHKNLPLTAALARLADTLPSTKFIAWCHDLAWTNPLYSSVLYAGYPWALLKTTLPNVRYVAISPQRQEEILEVFEPTLVPDEVTVVPNGIAPNEFLGIGHETQAIMQIAGFDPEDHLILLLPARLTPRKNIELAIQTVAILKETEPTVRLVVTGPVGPHNPQNDHYVQKLLDLRAELEVEQEVILLAQHWQDSKGQPKLLADETIADFYRIADALFFPSAQEGFGIPILEAGLAHLPIFCSRLVPFWEIAAKAPYYFELTDTPETIAHLISTKLNENAQYRLRRTVLDRYTWKNIFERQIKPLIEM